MGISMRRKAKKQSRPVCEDVPKICENCQGTLGDKKDKSPTVSGLSNHLMCTNSRAEAHQ